MNILIVGDVMLDWDNFAKVDRLSPEASVLVADVENEVFRLGGALNVAHNLKILGAEVTVIGVLGTDYFGDCLLSEVEKEHLNHFLLRDSNRRTTVKQRFFNDQNIHLFRGDREDRHVISQDIQAKIHEYINSSKNTWDGIIIVDYNKGLIEKNLAKILSKVNIPIFADLKPSQMKLFYNLEAITSNAKEAIEYARRRTMNFDENIEIYAVAQILREHSKIVIITMGKDGLYFYQDGNGQIIAPDLDNSNSIVDTCGCGDVITAVYSYACLEGNNPLISAKIANCAAGITTRDVGVSCISKDKYNEIVNKNKV